MIPAKPFDEEAAVATDAYIDLLLARHPIHHATPAHARPIPAHVSGLIDLLHSGLPRFHPSFSFEEQLADRLRTAATLRPPAELIRLRLPRRTTSKAPNVDRRMLLSGAAIAASGVSVAAVYAWRQAARRARLGRAHREVPA
jgi:hypothetical protein